MTTIPPPPPPIPPKRGGIHPTYGKFIGGSKLNNSYEAVGASNSLYRFSTQRRHEKTISSIERALRESRDSTTTIKFNGTLEPATGNSTEIGKERFVTLLKKRVKEHGLQTFYWIRDIDGKVVELFENAHRFKLETVIAEHNRRMIVSTERSRTTESKGTKLNCHVPSWNHCCPRPSRRKSRFDSATVMISSYCQGLAYSSWL